MSESISLEVADETGTEAVARQLATLIPAGTVVVLRGTLGAGKTRFVKAFASACEVNPDDVTSPTFVLCKHYAGSRPITHMDVYRIADADEFASLGPEDLFANDGVTFIEWGERVLDVLPHDHLEIAIELGAGTHRTFHLTGGPWLSAFRGGTDGRPDTA